MSTFPDVGKQSVPVSVVGLGLAQAQKECAALQVCSRSAVIRDLAASAAKPHPFLSYNGHHNCERSTASEYGRKYEGIWGTFGELVFRDAWKCGGTPQGVQH